MRRRESGYGNAAEEGGARNIQSQLEECKSSAASWSFWSFWSTFLAATIELFILRFVVDFTRRQQILLVNVLDFLLLIPFIASLFARIAIRLVLDALALE